MRALRRAGLLGVVVAVLLTLVSADPAAATIGINGGASMPSAVAVGQTALSGSITFTNTNMAPEHTESNIVTQIRLAPSCGATGTAANLCPQPDPGVFSITSPATGRAGTACAGRTFTVSAPDASGVVTFTPTGGALVLAPSQTCSIDFTFSVLKVPTIDADPPAPGVQTRANFLITMQGSIHTGAVASSLPSLVVTVLRATPTLSTQASQNVHGTAISDTATVSGVPGVATPTGTVTFSVYGPNNATCTGAPVASSTNALSGGTATSSSFPVSQNGVYRFVASYSGDANYLPLSGVCNAPNESVVVTGAPAAADFDGNGTTDRSVYRNGGWLVHGQSPNVFLGLTGDILVPADYDGNDDTERAVYRDGAWFVEGQPTVYLGLAGDIPVPGDYDGDGDAERAVFRPQVGAWYVEGQPTVYLGQSGDIPVPADYDGNGDVERAVYRDGAWFVEGQPTVYLGLAGDIPVPGDYDGDGDADRGVFRPSAGAWFVEGQPTVFLGAPGDVPVPGDYDGDDDVERAVYRDGAWFAEGQNTVYFGLDGDIPLPLPAAIYRAFF